MVRKGSTVRVRQRASSDLPATAGIFFPGSANLDLALGLWGVSGALWGAMHPPAPELHDPFLEVGRGVSGVSHEVAVQALLVPVCDPVRCAFVGDQPRSVDQRRGGLATDLVGDDLVI